MMRTNSGKALNIKWNIGAQHVLYHKGGTWFNVLERFPGALCDPNGYVLFATKSEYELSSHLHIGKHTNVPNGIASLNGYIRMSA